MGVLDTQSSCNNSYYSLGLSIIEGPSLLGGQRSDNDLSKLNEYSFTKSQLSQDSSQSLKCTPFFWVALGAMVPKK